MSHVYEDTSHVTSIAGGHDGRRELESPRVGLEDTPNGVAPLRTIDLTPRDAIFSRTRSNYIAITSFTVALLCLLGELYILFLLHRINVAPAKVNGSSTKGIVVNAPDLLRYIHN
jgi:hypothetical protein